MPELPEVQTIINGLRVGNSLHPGILGCMVKSCTVLWEKSIQEPDPGKFCHTVIGEKFRDLSRRGKYAIFYMSGSILVFHLRMSGDLLIREGNEEIKLHDRLVMGLDNGFSLVFSDPRKFGRIWLVDELDSVIGSLGPEPFDPYLTGEEFYKKLQGKKRQIKPLLMDQSFLAGMGNIYTDEALFSARIHPQTLSNQIIVKKSKQLLEAIRDSLDKGMRNHGASIDWVYRGGDYQNYFQVYRRTGLPCFRCGSPIKRIVLGQRSTHFCPECQV